MRRSVHWTLMLGVLLALTFGVAACGGDGGESGEQGTTAGTPAEGKKGGKLIALWASDTDHIDPGITYSQWGLPIVRATQKTLYAPKMDDGSVVQPELAEGDPQVSEDGCAVTVKIKDGVKFSPPVDREVTSKDVKYAIERGFFNNANNGYAQPYFGTIKGAKVGAEPGTEIPGITTPDDLTVQFDLTPGEGSDKCAGGLLAQALVMPLTAPVPEEYAKEFDAGKNNLYGQNQVATGPYMVENDASGKAIGYEAGRRIHLVRNPNWDPSLDSRPAYVDEIEIQQGNDDATVMSRKILEGESMINGDQPPTPAVLKQALTQQKDQVILAPGGGGRWIAFNMTLKPFDDINVRKAVAAGMDRDALRKTRGGEVVGDIPTHYLPPGMAGFDDAGGMEGFGLDFMANEKGDKALMAEYFKKAGYASGKYEGSEKLLMVGRNDGVAADTGEVAAGQLREMGFDIEFRQVTLDTMYNKFCNVPKAEVALCPNVGWQKDFSDPQTYLGPTFDGEGIIPTNNVNWSQLDDPEINKAMNDAEVLIEPAERAKAWAEIDRMITEQVPAVNWIWDKAPNIRSSNVQGVVDEGNGLWDFAHTSLK